MTFKLLLLLKVILDEFYELYHIDHRQILTPYNLYLHIFYLPYNHYGHR